MPLASRKVERFIGVGQSGRFPTGFSAGHCAKIIDVRAALVPTPICFHRRLVLSSSQQLAGHCYKIVQSFFNFFF